MQKDKDIFQDRRQSNANNNIVILGHEKRNECQDFDPRPWYLKVRYAKDLTPTTANHAA